VTTKTAIATLYEGHYHHGVAALINSAIAIDFDGVFIVGYRDRLPPWVRTLTAVGEDEYAIAETRIIFYREQAPRHLGYQKPFAALEIFDRFPEIETVFYADPDVTFLAPWKFFLDWANLGITLVEDSNFQRVHENHPWRTIWKELLSRRGLQCHSVRNDSYANSGFFGISRRDKDFLKLWADVTLTYEASGKTTESFEMVERWKGVVGDQDLMATAMMSWTGPFSIMGPEAMGFTGYFFILSHAIESPKPWDKSYFLSSLRGIPPSAAAGYFLEAASGTVQSFSKNACLLRKVDFRAAKLISRVWRRS
jgi:hypothetical protein